MTWTTADYQYMSRALQLARRGRYSTPPNPCVGCVIVKDDTILAEGWHQTAGKAHAEIEALNQLSVAGTTCYVSLEPCAHQGRTASCADALIKAGVKYVVVAAIDPNPLVAGKGLQRLDKAGIKTASGLLEAQARHLNRGFEMRMRQGRPFVTCKLAMSLDAKTALADGDSKWISSAASRKDVQKLRARSCAIMTSSVTVVRDNPSLNLRGSNLPTGPEYDRQPLRVIIDSDLKVPADANVLNLPGDVIIFHSSTDRDKQEKLKNTGVELVYTGRERGKQFLETVLRHLAGEKQINTILLESGATLAGQMLQAGFIDELMIYIAPALLGQGAKNLLQLPLLEAMSDRLTLAFHDVRHVGKDIRIRAAINRIK